MGYSELLKRLCLLLLRSILEESFSLVKLTIVQVTSHPPPRDVPNPGIKPRSPAMHMDSLPAEPPGKPKSWT